MHLITKHFLQCPSLQWCLHAFMPLCHYAIIPSCPYAFTLSGTQFDETFPSQYFANSSQARCRPLSALIRAEICFIFSTTDSRLQYSIASSRSRFSFSSSSKMQTRRPRPRSWIRCALSGWSRVRSTGNPFFQFFLKVSSSNLSIDLDWNKLNATWEQRHDDHRYAEIRRFGHSVVLKKIMKLSLVFFTLIRSPDSRLTPPCVIIISTVCSTENWFSQFSPCMLSAMRLSYSWPITPFDHAFRNDETMWNPRENSKDFLHQRTIGRRLGWWETVRSNWTHPAMNRLVSLNDSDQHLPSSPDWSRSVFQIDF